MNALSSDTGRRAGGSRLAVIGIVCLVVVIVVVVLVIRARKAATQVGEEPAAAPPAQAVEKPAALPIAPEEPKTDTGAVAQAAAPVITLTVYSQPEDATLFVDGQDLGRTPTRVGPLTPGLHTIRLQLDGYKPLEDRIELAEGQAVSLSKTLEPILEGLAVESTPPGARVTIDGEARGVTPLALADLAPGSHTVRLELKDFQSEERTVEVRKGDRTLATFALKTTLGTVSVSGLATGTVVYIDGQAVAAGAESEGGGQKALVQPGDHVVQVSRPGHVTKTYNVRVGASGTLDLNAGLEPEFTADTEVETTDGSIYRGKLRKQMTDGGLRLEIAPGQYRNLPASIIADVRQL